jgi:hypothetical protein
MVAAHDTCIAELMYDDSYDDHGTSPLLSQRDQGPRRPLSETFFHDSFCRQRRDSVGLAIDWRMTDRGF